MINNLTHLRAAVKCFAFIVGTLVLVPIQMVWMVFVWHPRRQSPIVRLWFRYVQWLLGFRITVINRKFLSKRPKLFLSNHISYLDIIVLGAAFDCFFVSKSDVADWPVFGFLSKIGGTVFISRKRSKIKEQMALLARHIERRRSLFIFPEGTSGNGRHILPFKSGLLNALQEVKKKPVLQPVSLAYTHANGEKMVMKSEFDLTAWYGDMTLMPHLWTVFGQKSVQATIMLHPALTDYEGESAKGLAVTLHDTVKQGFEGILSR